MSSSGLTMWCRRVPFGYEFSNHLAECFDEFCKEDTLCRHFESAVTDCSDFQDRSLDRGLEFDVEDHFSTVADKSDCDCRAIEASVYTNRLCEPLQSSNREGSALFSVLGCLKTPLYLVARIQGLSRILVSYDSNLVDPASSHMLV
jgi:hypothetical protein